MSNLYPTDLSEYDLEKLVRASGYTWGDYINPAMKSIAGQKEGVITEVLNAVMPGWTMDDVRIRCRWVRYPGSPVETLQVDGEDVLEMHPIEVEPPVMEFDRYVSRLTQNYRKLGRAAPQPEGSRP